MRDEASMQTRMSGEDLNKWFESRDRHSGTDLKMEVQWIWHFGDVVEALSTEDRPPWPYFSVFWGQLGGILGEMRERYAASYEMWKSVSSSSPYAPTLALQKRVLEAINALHGQLSADELVYADLMRQTNAHVYQHGFRPQVKKTTVPGTATLKDQREVKALGKPLPLDDIDAAINRVLRPANGNDRVIAAALAARLRAYVPPILELLRELASQRCTPEQDAAFEKLRAHVLATATL